jgi:hypothetical protein
VLSDARRRCARPGRGWLGAAALAASCLAAHPVAAGCPRFVARSEGLPTAREWRTHPALGDVDADGDLDLAALPRKGRGPGVWLYQPHGAWQPASTGLVVPGFTCGVGVDLADAFVYLGDGKGVWSMQELPAMERDLTGFEDLAFGDLNDDGHVDIAAVGSSRGGIAVFHGDGRGGWTRANTTLPRRGRGNDLKLADVDGNGHLDVVSAFVAAHEEVREEGGRRLPVLWLNDGAGGFRSASDGLPDEGDFRSVAVGDVDGDGDVDLAISGGFWPGRPPLLVYLNDGEARWRASPGGHPESPPDEVYEGIELADFDGDGHLDLVGVSHRDAGIRIWAGDGAGSWNSCASTGLPGARDELRGWGVVVGDLTGDGRPDLAAGFGRNSAGSLEAWTQP